MKGEENRRRVGVMQKKKAGIKGEEGERREEEGSRKIVGEK